MAIMWYQLGENLEELDAALRTTALVHSTLCRTELVAELIKYDVQFFDCSFRIENSALVTRIIF